MCVCTSFASFITSLRMVVLDSNHYFLCFMQSSGLYVIMCENTEHSMRAVNDKRMSHASHMKLYNYRTEDFLFKNFQAFKRSLTIRLLLAFVCYLQLLTHFFNLAFKTKYKYYHSLEVLITNSDKFLRLFSFRIYDLLS